MRKFQLTLLLVLLAATSVFAQRGHGQHRMLADLDLTTEQQAQIEAIRKDTRSQLEALRGETADNEATRESAKALREKSKAATMAVLTPAQRTELEAKAAARKEAMKKVDKKAMAAELKAYRTENMEPVMRAARGQFDQYLAAEDRTEIERLRTVFAAKPGKKGHGEKGHGKKGRGKGGQKGDGKADKGAHREAAAQWQADHADDIASLNALTDKYKVELERVEKLLTPQEKTWRQEMSAIKAKYLPEGTERGVQAKSRKGKAGKGEHRAGGKRKGGNRKAAAFLLLKG